MTRDDVKWTVLMMLAVIASLAVLSEGVVRELGLPSVIVPWLPWCRLVTMIAGVVGAKFGNSPLPGKSDPPVSNETLDKIARSVPIVLIVGLLGLAAFSLTGCGPKQYHTAVVANTSIAEAIFALQDAEIAAHNDGLADETRHTIYKAQILRLLLAGDDLTVAVQHWDPKMPPPANVAVAVVDVSKLLADVQVISPRAADLIQKASFVLKLLQQFGVLSADAQLLDMGGLA
jgi:hypothetical protein